jgi:hypothetical protein
MDDLERKVLKIKCEKQNVSEFLEELKEESDNLKKENQRII